MWEESDEIKTLKMRRNVGCRGAQLGGESSMTSPPNRQPFRKRYRPSDIHWTAEACSGGTSIIAPDQMRMHPQKLRFGRFGAMMNTDCTW